MTGMISASEGLFVRKLGEIRLIMKELQNFKASLSRKGGLVVGNGFVSFEEPAWIADQWIVGPEIDSITLDDFVGVVVPYLHTCTANERIHHIFQGGKPRSVPEILEAWSFVWCEQFSKDASCYWSHVVSVRDDQKFRNRFAPTAVVPQTFGDAFPHTFAWQEAHPIETARCSHEERPVNNPPYQMPSYIPSHYPPLHQPQLESLAATLGPEKRAIWDASEDVRANQKRMLVDEAGADKDDMVRLERGFKHSRTMEIRELTGVYADKR